MKTLFTSLHAPIWSWFSQSFYDDVARRWRGMAVWFLLGLALVTSAVPSARMGWAWYELGQSDTMAELQDVVPAFRIRNGVVSSDVPQPHVRRMQDGDEEVSLILDTTGEYTHLDAQGGTAILLMRDSVTMRRPGRRVETHSLHEIETFDFNHDVLMEWYQLIGMVGIPLHFAVTATFTFCFRLLLALGLGGLVYGLTRSSRPWLTYTGAVRLTVMAMVPPMLMLSLLGATGLIDAFWFAVFAGSMLLTLCWMALGISGLGISKGSGDAGGEGPGDTSDAWTPPSTTA